MGVDRGNHLAERFILHDCFKPFFEFAPAPLTGFKEAECDLIRQAAFLHLRIKHLIERNHLVRLKMTALLTALPRPLRLINRGNRCNRHALLAKVLHCVQHIVCKGLVVLRRKVRHLFLLLIAMRLAVDGHGVRRAVAKENNLLCAQLQRPVHAPKRVFIEGIVDLAVIPDKALPGAPRVIEFAGFFPCAGARAQVIPVNL